MNGRSSLRRWADSSARATAFDHVGSALRFLDRRHGLALAGVLLLMACFAWAHRFMSDDAFISFRYARNLVEGHGLVWNLGERVEGYTNFLWTLLMTLPFLLRIDPISYCYALGLLLSTLTLYCASRIASLLLGSSRLALLAVVLIGSNPTFAAHATGGLETQLLACLQTAMLWLVLAARREDDPGVARQLLLALLSAAALMTRLDSAPIAGIVLMLATYHAWRAPRPPARRAALLLALWVPAFLAVGAWCLWKISYYGDLLPNTFYAKRDGFGAWTLGLGYLRTYLTSYLLAPALLIVALAIPRLVSRSPLDLVTLLSVLIAQAAYIAAAGGDFMEFRMLVPVLPVLYLLIVWAALGYLALPLARAALVALVVIGAIHHVRSFTFTSGIETVSDLESHLVDPAADWIGVGRRLGEIFRDDPDVRLATTAAGAIPFYSRLPTLDMLGLNDRWIARHGIKILPPQPGHCRVAPFAYLVQQRVHLVLAHPWVALPSIHGATHYAHGELARFMFLLDAFPEVIPPAASIVEVPLDADRVLVALYLTPHPSIEALVAAGQWRRFELAMPPHESS